MCDSSPEWQRADVLRAFEEWAAERSEERALRQGVAQFIRERIVEAGVVPQNVVRLRDMSRDDREGDPADRARTLTCVADGSTSAN